MSGFTSRPSKRALWTFGLVAGAACLFAFGVDFGTVRDRIESLNGWLFFVLLSILPIFGFPVSVLQILAGVKFGFWAGVGLTSVAIGCHLLGVHWLGSSVLRRPVARWLSKTRYQLPDIPAGQGRTIAFLMPFLPGSYTVKNYLMVLGGISLPTLLWVCAPVYAVRASSGIFLGGATAHLTPAVITILVVAKIVAIGLTAWVIKRYGAQLKMSAIRPASTPSILPQLQVSDQRQVV